MLALVRGRVTSTEAPRLRVCQALAHRRIRKNSSQDLRAITAQVIAEQQRQR
jgi:hypothetical protein